MLVAFDVMKNEGCLTAERQEVDGGLEVDAIEQTGKVQEIILVYPLDADITRRRVSVLTPVGAALLGLSVNQTISFHTRIGERRELTVLKVRRAV